LFKFIVQVRRIEGKSFVVRRQVDENKKSNEEGKEKQTNRLREKAIDKVAKAEF
jgi:hypothetical protein